MWESKVSSSVSWGAETTPSSKACLRETQGDFLAAVKAKSSADRPVLGKPNPLLTRRNPVCWTATATWGSALRRRRWPTLRLLRACAKPWWTKWYSLWDPKTYNKMKIRVRPILNFFLVWFFNFFKACNTVDLENEFNKVVLIVQSQTCKQIKIEVLTLLSKLESS